MIITDHGVQQQITYDGRLLGATVRVRGADDQHWTDGDDILEVDNDICIVV